MSTLGLAQTKIAVVDLQEAILLTDYAKNRIEQLNNSEHYKLLSSEYNTIRADIQALSKDAETNAKKWDNKQKQEFQEKAMYAREDLESSTKKLRAKKQQLFSEIIQFMQEKAKKALGELIDAEKIGLLLDRKAALSAGPEYDLTAKLVIKLNNADARAKKEP